jgi:hypothetical protein
MRDGLAFGKVPWTGAAPRPRWHGPHRTRQHWLRSLRCGDLAAALYDGKSGRAQRATVIRQRKGVVVAVFKRWAEEGEARVRFVDAGGWDAGGWMPFHPDKAWYRLAPADGARFDPDPDDALLWPDGTWLFRRDAEAGAAVHKSDDYEVLCAGTPQWRALTEDPKEAT